MLFILYARTPFWMNIVVGPIISYLSIVMNIVIFVALFHKKIRSPTTVLMQGLALSDGLTAVCTYGFEPFFNAHYEAIANDTYNRKSKDTDEKGILANIIDTDAKIEELKWLVGLRFPYCLMHFCLSNLGETFHLVSILLTASLGLQKLLAVTCPIWTKIQINERKSCIVCFTCFLFTLAVNVPKLFIISLSGGKVGDVCLVSEPQHTIQKYILAYYPIMYSVILVVAVVTMLISTFYIIYILCRRKRVRGHAAASRVEKKSCILIVCVMTVFFLSEVPRLIVTSTLIGTYRSNFDMQNVALQKLSTEIHKILSACTEDSLIHISGDSCFSDFNELPSHDKQILVNQREKSFAENDKFIEDVSQFMGDVVYKGLFQQSYYEYLKDDIVRIYIFLMTQFLKVSNQYIYEFATIDYCRKSNNKDILNLQECQNHYFKKLRISSTALVSSPYSEQMNYLLNIVWGFIDINLENLKLLIEILKLSMIIGSASNFLIYIVMSEKLRDALKNTLKCNEPRKTRIDATEMQIRG